MSNEDLVVLIQAGERDKLAELWEKVRRFLVVQAHKRLVLSGGLGGVEFRDLYNSGYLALIAAADSFRLDAGCSFISWLALALKNAFAEAGGYRSGKQACDPLHQARSTDVLVYDEDSDTTVGDLVPDPAAVQAFEDVETGLCREKLRAALKTAIDTMPEDLRMEIISRYWYNCPGDGKAHTAALRYLRHPKQSRTLLAFWDAIGA